MIKHYYDYPTVGESAAFISYSSLKDLMVSTGWNTVLVLHFGEQWLREDREPRRARPWDKGAISYLL